MTKTEDVLNPMTKTECREWIAALRSGEYEQGRGLLRIEAYNQPTEYCCLGVEREIHPIACWAVSSDSTTLRTTSNSIRLVDQQQRRLAQMNDAEGLSFFEIADHIETEILPGLKD